MSLLGDTLGLISLQNANNQTQQGYANANGITSQGYGNARNAIDTGYGTALNNINSGYATGQNYLNNAYATATPQLTSNYGAAIGGFAPYQNAGGIAANELGRLISSGYASHQFNTQDLYNGLSPNYDFQLKQGQLTNAQANNASGGMIGGNAQIGLQKYTQDYAGNAYQQAFNNYQNQRSNIFGVIQPVANMGLAATGKVADLYSNLGNNLANLTTGYGSSSAGLSTNLATNQAGLNTGQAINNANLYTGEANARSGYNVAAGNAAAQNTVAQGGQQNKIVNDIASIFNLA
jgi:hypothetical protein